MKKMKNLFRFTVIVLCLVLALCCFACADKTNEEPTPAPEEQTPAAAPVTVSLDRERATVDLHDKLTLTATVEGSEDSVGWLSSDVRVLNVSDGVVTAVGVGSATVSAYVGNSLAACTVNVVDSFTAPVLEVEHSVTVGKGGSYVSPVSVLWKNSPVDGAEYSVRLSSEAGVASVTEVSDGLRFTGISEGEAVFTVTSKVYGFTLVENITVNVCASGNTVVMGEGFAPAKGGYVANVSLHPTVGIKEIPLKYTVFENGRETSSTLLWKVKDESVVRITGGKITAVAEGETEITASLGGSSVTIFVNAYRPEIKASKRVFIETLNHTAATASFSMGERIEGDIREVTLDGKPLTGVSYGNGRITYNTEALSVSLSATGEKQLTVETDKASYKFDAMLVTQVIDNFDELLNFGTVAKAMYNDGGYNAGGYFVLGGDIDCSGRKYIGTLPSNPQMSGETKWNPYKFHGTFDGNGYNIANFNPDQNGLIPLMGKDCYIKNVSFTDAVQESTGDRVAILAYAGAGNLENVYIGVKKFVANGTVSNGIITAGGSWETALVNVFAEIENLTVPSGKIFYLINASAKMQNVYAIGLGSNLIRTASQPKGDSDLYDKFDSRADMAAAGVAAAFTDPFWTNVNGVPYPTNLID